MKYRKKVAESLIFSQYLRVSSWKNRQWYNL